MQRWAWLIQGGGISTSSCTSHSATQPPSCTSHPAEGNSALERIAMTGGLCCTAQRWAPCCTPASPAPAPWPGPTPPRPRPQPALSQLSQSAGRHARPSPPQLHCKPGWCQYNARSEQLQRQWGTTTRSWTSSPSFAAPRRCRDTHPPPVSSITHPAASCAAASASASAHAPSCAASGSPSPVRRSFATAHSPGPAPTGSPALSSATDPLAGSSVSSSSDSCTGGRGSGRWRR